MPKAENTHSPARRTSFDGKEREPLLRLFWWELESMLHRTVVLLRMPARQSPLYFFWVSRRQSGLRWVGLSALDPVAYLGVSALFATVVLFAGYVPAPRATAASN